MTPECVSCGRAVTDAYLCTKCTEGLERDLGDLVSLDNDLLVTYTRQARIGRNVGARSVDRPLPWHEKAAHERHALKAILVATVRDLSPDEAVLADTVAALSGWLLCHVDRIRQHLAADEITSDVHDALVRGSLICSGPPLTIYAGPCQQTTEDGQCGAELYVEAAYDERTETAKPVESVIKCPRCLGETNIDRQRDYLLAEIDGMLVGASTAARVLAALGIDVGSATIRKWKERGQIVGKGLDRDGHETYLIADIRALHEQAQQRAEKRKVAR